MKLEYMLQIKESNQEDFKILSRNMTLFSSSSVNPIGQSTFLLLQKEDSSVVAIVECGSAIPEEVDLHFGKTLRYWNLWIARAGDTQHYLKSALTYLAAYALKNKYDSIVIEILPEARPATIQTGFIVRESPESDKLYATKRLF
jgi:hypothetical protein